MAQPLLRARRSPLRPGIATVWLSLTISALLALPEGALAYGSADPSWGVVGSDGLRKRALPPMNETPVHAAVLGGDAGMIGAAAMALEESGAVTL